MRELEPNQSAEVPVWFSAQMEALFLLYPGRAQAPGTTLSWWRFLHDLPRDKLEQAFVRAPQLSALYLPSAQAVREAALALPKSAPAAQTRPVPALPAPVKLGADNPFLYLAQKWEFESLELGLDPEKPSPKHIAKRRMQELLDLLADHGPRDMPELEPAKITNRRTA